MENFKDIPPQTVNLKPNVKRETLNSKLYLFQTFRIRPFIIFKLRFCSLQFAKSCLLQSRRTQGWSTEMQKNNSIPSSPDT